MRLPNGDRALVELRKLTDYCLSQTHSTDRNKARVFRAALGLTTADAETLRHALLAAARINETAEFGERDAYGQRYTLDFAISGPAGNGIVRSNWIVRTGEDFPRLTTCYVL